MEDAAADTLEKALALAMAGYRHMTGASVQDSFELAEGIMVKLRWKYIESVIMVSTKTKAQANDSVVTVALGVGCDTDDPSVASEITADSSDIEASGTNAASTARLHVANNNITFDPMIPTTSGTNTPGVKYCLCNVVGCGMAVTRRDTLQAHYVVYSPYTHSLSFNTSANSKLLGFLR
ncbi:hypothetical protein GQ607_017847 [Colletotrichum asianum]|uniref:Uncharacterized protein n=1 Tax=Colletotrichum asianum TaxID=702518 RepID=A0A8H3ZCY1_9PEZI|nr:hypothetical protein GQ607_017847 [Colletotrichum asianum]